MEKKELQISPFLVFFLIHSVQVGVGVLGFQRVIMKSAGNDAWMAVIAGGIMVSAVIWYMYLLLNRHQKNLIDIHKILFGKWIGNTFSFIWICYWLLSGIVVLRSYIEVVEVWVFPTINIFMFALIFMILIYYCVSGGFRIVTGLSFFGVVIPFYIFFTFFFPIEYAHFQNLLPVWNHTIKEMSVATKDMVLGYLGISTLLMYYPYIKQAKKSQKWAQLGHLLTVTIYLIIIIISIGFYSEEQIAKEIWATLSLWKIVKMPFVERFEYIGITSWVIIILPNICLPLWAATKGIQQIFNTKPKKILIMLLFILFCAMISIRGRDNINLLNEYMSKFGIILLFTYLPFITIISFFVMKRRREKLEKNS
ncbi:spore germination protein (amino acid permease) [Cytobacillus eiseniae]|uniref:Spore germination protein (Amino acid permease) n=1 Tax=Cytobacillus eiseniae TaxID=762947 RepID=A0ABS4RCS4_9BACI|nr:GerAB/ArcD/ProY family transporter [Cytobacillus eiseniae]MBP2239657.1 spore germination protein (amino acid permease) [Cytobacillus eiseniae]